MELRETYVCRNCRREGMREVRKELVNDFEIKFIMECITCKARHEFIFVLNEINLIGAEQND